MIACADIQRQLSEFVDGLLPSAAHAEVLAHVRECADCSGVLADMERIVSTARQLGPVTPPEHIWLEVAGQMRLEAPASARPVPAARPSRAIWQWAGLTAALLAVTAGVYVYQRRAVAPPAVTQAPPVTGSIQAVNDELTQALDHYQRAVAELEAVTRDGDSTIDPAVVNTVRTSLGSIDAAIAESRAALASNPDSDPARDSLFEALRRKISVLQATVTLINEMRQGDPAGATRAVEGTGRQS
jgi:anti-sigma factor RsiW